MTPSPSDDSIISSVPRFKVSFSEKALAGVSVCLLLLMDYLSVVGAIYAAHFIREVYFMSHFSWLMQYHLENNYSYTIIPLIYLTLMYFSGLYRKRLPYWQSTELLFRACFFAMIFIVGLMYATGETKEVSRLVIGLIWILSFIFLACTRYMGKRMMGWLGIWQKPVIIVGAGKTAEILSKTFEDPYLGYKVLGVIEDNHTERPLVKKYQWLGTFEQADKIMETAAVDEVIIATPGLEREELVNLVYRIQPYVKNVTLIPNLFGIPMSNIDIEGLLNERIFLIRLCNNLAEWHNRIFKLVFDNIATVCGLIFVLPLMACISVLIYIDSPGPVFFAHRRVGAGGAEFDCYKFRTMAVNAGELLKEYLEKNPVACEEWDKECKLKNDPRITKIGKFLRKTSLDELPQLLNVLKGDMSLVGPRPIIQAEVPRYGNLINDYYLVRPGITGYWQVNGRNNVNYDTRVQMDSWYVRNWSLWLDIVLLLKTVKVVLKREGAY